MVGLFLFPQTEIYESTLLNYLSNIVLFVVDIAEVHCQITKTTRRKAVKHYAVAHSSEKKYRRISVHRNIRGSCYRYIIM